MAVCYTIAAWRSPLAEMACTFETRMRAPAAHDRLYAAVYAMLEADALLDRPIARKLAKAALDCDVSPPPLGYYRVERFKLRADDPFSPFVEFRAHRI